MQNKIQQQQLQHQLQQLQQQQQQHQQQQQQAQQQQQQQQQNVQQTGETINAKASLAAFINQQQAQQQLNNIIQAANNNNNTNNKLTGRRSIVLGQQQAAIVLNHLNLVKQKNGVLGHQRTSSLPSFLGALVQIDEKPKPEKPKSQSQNTQTTNPTRRAGSEEQTFVVQKPPPQYEEATKTLKQESGDETKRSKNVKSQIVDDVLEILIKNGELPPSAANDPATPTTPGKYDPEKGLIYTPAAPPPPPPPPLPQPGFAVTLPTSITLTSQAQPPSQFNLPNTTFSNSSPFTLTTQSVNPPTYTLTQTYIPPSTNIPGAQTTSNNITFSISNSNFTEANSNNSFSSGINYLENTEFMSTENSDFNLNNNSNDQNFHSNSLDYILSSELSSNDNLLPTEYGNGNINLKELGLDLETLDSMDFSQLDCKIDGNDTEMESISSNKTDQLINNNPDLIKTELIEPMEMDDNWLDSLIPSSTANQNVNQFNNSTSAYDFLQSNDNSYDPLIGNTQDPFALFDIHDNDFKLSSSSLSWDKVDFAT